MSARLMGRDAERDRVTALLGTASGGLSVALIEGEAGVGKSALARAVADQARDDGWQVLGCSPTQAEARYAYVGLADLIGRFATDDALSALPGPQQRALQTALRIRDDDQAGGDLHADVPTVGSAVQRLLTGAARDQPLLLLIDDVQWLDPATASAVGFALRRIDPRPGDSRLALLVTRRAQQPGTLPLDLERHVAADAHTSVWLDGLGQTALYDVLRDRLGVKVGRPALRRLHALCRGNPFYALEMVRSVITRYGALPADGLFPLPESLTVTVTERIAQTDDDLRALLLTVSAMGLPSLSRLREAFDGDLGPEDVDAVVIRAERAGLLGVDGDRLMFEHPLFASAVYNAAPAARRREVHARLAEVEPELESRARHLGLATLGPHATVATALEEAANDARLRGATEVASDLLRVAIVRTPVDDEPSRWRRAVLLGDVLLEAGDLEATAAWLELQIPALPAGAMRARARMTLAVTEWYRDGGRAAAAVIAQALDDAAGDAGLLGQIHSRLAVFSESDMAQARDHAAEAVTELTRAGESDLLGAAMCNLFYYEVLTGRPPRRELLAEGLRMEDPRGSTDQSTTPGFWYLATDDWDHARRRFETMRERERARGDLSSEAELLTRLGEVAAWFGDWPAARRYAQEATTAARELGEEGAYQPSERLLLQLDVFEGRLDQAATVALAEADRFEQLGHRLATASYLSAVTLAKASAGDYRAVLETTERAAAHLVSIGLVEPLGRLDPAPERAEALVAVGELDAAEAVLDSIAQRLDRIPRPWLAAAHVRGAAQLAAARGNLAEA
ncbi:MAG: AAA family ATPase, partial [Kineosporiaceae bacterium]